MAIEPRPGLVIRYDFLWKEDQQAGRTEGIKDRPCVILLMGTPRDDGSREVGICPITHTPPGQGEQGVEIPHDVAKALGLDQERSWIKTHQINKVIWEKNRIPFGVVPDRRGDFVLGQMRHDIGSRAFEQVRETHRRRSLGIVSRDDQER